MFITPAIFIAPRLLAIPGEAKAGQGPWPVNPDSVSGGQLRGGREPGLEDDADLGRDGLHDGDGRRYLGRSARLGEVALCTGTGYSVHGTNSSASVR